MFSKSLKIFLTTLVMVTFLACSNSSSSSSEPASGLTQDTVLKSVTQFEDYESLIDALNAESITTTREFSAAYIQADPLEFFLKLKAANETLQAEDMLNFMKTLEQDIVLQQLVKDTKITQNALESVQTLDLSFFELKEGFLRNWNTNDANESINETTQTLYNQQQLVAYNNELAAFEKPQLSYEEFISLKNEINNTPLFFVNFGGALQNVDVNTSSNTASLSPALKALSLVSTGVLNPVDETLGALDLAPMEYLQFLPHQFMACQEVSRIYPFQIMGTEYVGEFNGTPIFKELNTSIPLLGDEDGKRFFQINETGLAELVLYNASLTSVPITIEHNGVTVVSTTLESGEKQKVFIPVLDEDVCVPYYMTKDDLKLRATIVTLQKPNKMAKIFDTSRGAYDFINTFNTTLSGDTFMSANLAEFSFMNTTPGATTTLRLNDDADTENLIQYIIKSPSGKLYSNLTRGDIEQSVELEDGKWLIFSIPAYGYTLTDNKLTTYGVVKENLNGYAENSYTFLTASLESAHLRKFVIAEMKNAEFSHDGEDAGKSAEVTLSLHSNLAPKLSLGADISRSLTGNPSYDAYTCWLTHGKTLELFNANEVCYSYLDGFKDIVNDYTSKVLLANNNPLLSFEALQDNMKLSILGWYGQKLNKELNDERFKQMFETYASIYEEWKNNVVQINDINFPASHHYGIKDSKIILGDGDFYTVDDFYHPNIPMNIPILALTKERMAQTTAPFAFEYSASDADEIDTSAQLFAIAKYVVNQALAVATSNYAALICNTVDTMQEIRQNEINGEDDPIGEADFFVNRFSSTDAFYGLGNGELKFSISGLANIPNYYSSYDQNLEYAALACDVTGAVTAGYNLYNSMGSLISGDFFSGLSLDELKLDALKDLDINSQQYIDLSNAFDALKNATADSEIMKLLSIANKLDTFANGVDIFSALSDVVTDIGGLGGEARNVMRSEGNYFFSSFDERKTRADIGMKEVDALPITSTKVTLESVHIIDNLEDGNAEVKLRTRVGVVSDGAPQYQGTFVNNAPFMATGELALENGSNGYLTLPNLPFKGYLLKNKNFNGIKDGDSLNIGSEMELYNALYGATNNTAAIFVEIGLYEGDGGGVDDDMIGVLSKTFYLENLYNNAEGLRWTNLGNRVYRLQVNNYPVYSAENLATSVELINTQNMQQQMTHNNDRIYHPSATISFHIDVTLGEFTDYDEVDVNASLINGNIDDTKEVIDMNLLNLKEVSYLTSSTLQLQDVYYNQVVLSSVEGGLRVARINEDHTLSWRTAIDGSNVPTSYTNFFDFHNSVSYNQEEISGTTFIDDNHLLIFKRALPGYASDTKLVVMNIGENNSTVSVFAFLDLPSYSTHLETIRVDENTLKAFVTVPNLADNTGKIEIYDITNSTITKVGEYASQYTPIDIAVIDNKTLLVKSAKMKHIHFNTEFGVEHDEYWEKEMYLHLLELDSSNALNAKDIRQYTHTFNSFAEGTGLLNPLVLISEKRMKSINNGILNRAVYVNAYDDESDNSSKYIHLIHSAETQSYHFGDRRNTRIPNPLQNPFYTYYVDKYLNAYPSDLSYEGQISMSYTQLFQDENMRYQRVSDFEFLDSRYIISLVYLAPSMEHSLVLVDTQYVSNTLPVIVSEDFDKEHVMNYSSAFHTRVDFNITDAEKSANELNINFSIIDPETNTTIFTGTDSTQNVINDPDNFWFASHLTCDNGGVCQIDITYNKVCTSIRHNYVLHVQDGDKTITKNFSVRLEQTRPNIDADVVLVSTIYDDVYTQVSKTYSSYPLSDHDLNTCTNYSLVNKPTWVSSSEFYDFTSAKNFLTLTGSPLLGDAGEYDITIHASNPDYAQDVNLHITVMQPDIVPESFTFVPHNDVPISQIVQESVLITGITGPSPVTIVNGEYSLDNLIWSTIQGSISNNGTLYVRHTASASYSTSVTTTLNVGTVSAAFTSTTEPDPASNDSTPNAFSLVDNLSANLSEVVSSSVLITGINIEAGVSIINGEYSLDSGTTWLSTESNISNEQTIYVRHMSASTYDTNTSTTLVVGGVSDVFTSKTISLPLPDISNFPTQTTLGMGEEFFFTPINSGGEVQTWSIENKPDWLDFNTSTGALKGSSSNEGDFNSISIIATNTSGNDSVTFNLHITANNPPYIDGGTHNLDETQMLFTFTDDATWREAIHEVSVMADYSLSVILTEGVDYNLSAGVLTLYVNGVNSVPLNAGSWQITLKATNYYDSTIYTYVEAGEIDLAQAQSTFLNTPFYKGDVADISFHAVDRFGNNIAWGEVYYDFVRVDADTKFIEPYQIKSPDYALFSNAQASQSFYTDENGISAVSIKIPGCVDTDDGFTLNIKRSDGTLIKSLDYSSASDTCTDIDWKVRFDLASSSANIKLLSDTDGNVYIYSNTSLDTQTQSNAGGTDLYLTKLDRNGVKRWEKLIGGEAYEGDAQMLLASDGFLYLSATTTGSVESGVVNAGSLDWALIKVNPGTGEVIFVKQYATGSSDTVIGISEANSKINLYVNYDSITHIYSYDFDGFSVGSIVDTGIVYTQMQMNSAEYHVATNNAISKYLHAYDTNGTLSWMRGPQSADMYLDSEDNFYLTSQVKAAYPATTASYYDDTTPNNSAFMGIEKRSSIGNYQWSKILSNGGVYDRGGATRMDNAIYVLYTAPTYIDNALPRNLYMAVLNNFDGTLLETKMWEAGTINYNAINARTIIADEALHSLYIGVKVTGAMEDTDTYAGDTVVIKHLRYDAATDTRSGVVRNNTLRIVTDYDNHLQWIDNNLYEKQWSAFDAYCANEENLDGANSWRMPTLSELETTIDSANDPAINSVFTKVNPNNAYWSGDENNIETALGVFYWSGGGSDAFGKTEYLNIRCVRSY
jgi:hypothetical protein